MKSVPLRLEYLLSGWLSMEMSICSPESIPLERELPLKSVPIIGVVLYITVLVLCSEALLEDVRESKRRKLDDLNTIKKQRQDKMDLVKAHRVELTAIYAAMQTEDGVFFNDLREKILRVENIKVCIFDLCVLEAINQNWVMSCFFITFKVTLESSKPRLLYAILFRQLLIFLLHNENSKIPLIISSKSSIILKSVMSQWNPCLIEYRVKTHLFFS